MSDVLNRLDSPAFPDASQDEELRDRFVMAVVGGASAAVCGPHPLDADDLADKAFALADALIRRRNRPQ